MADEMSKALGVYLVGEGTTDIGDLAGHSSYRHGADGFIQPVVRKVSAKQRKVVFDGMKITSLGKKRLKATSDGHGRKAAQALALAQVKEADVLVFVKDVDKAAGRRKTRTDARRQTRRVAKEIADGFDAFRERSPSSVSVVTVIATPCRMIEAWALGDRKAVAEVVGPEGSNEAWKDPELLWGNKKDPESNHPKRVLGRVLGKKKVDTEVFAAIAEKADPKAISQSCPISFKPFFHALIDALG